MVYWEGCGSPGPETEAVARRHDPRPRGPRLPEPDAAAVLPFADVPCHLAGPFGLQCVWSPNGMFVRVYLANLSGRPVTGVRIEPRTLAGQQLVMVAAVDTDLTAIAARSTVAMGVRTVDDGPGELPLVIEVGFDHGRRVTFREVFAVSADRYG